MQDIIQHTSQILPWFLFSETRDSSFFFHSFQAISSHQFLLCLDLPEQVLLSAITEPYWHNNWLLFLQRSGPLAFREAQMLMHGFLFFLTDWNLSSCLCPPFFPSSLPFSLSFFFSLSLPSLSLFSIMISIGSVPFKRIDSRVLPHFYGVYIFWG